MRMIVIKQATSLSAVATRLRGTGADHAVVLQRLQRLNPHADVKRIEPGTVLLVPEQSAPTDESVPVSAQGFDAFRAEVRAALDATATRVGQGYDALASDRKEVSAVLKTAAVKRLLESDPDLKPQLDAVTQIFKKDQERAKEADGVIKLLREGGLAELEALAKLLSA